MSLVGIVIVFDLFTNLDEFVEAGKANGGAMRFIGRYYVFQTIGFFDRVGGMLALISAMFTVSCIQRNNEMTALMSAGISRIRDMPADISAVISLLRWIQETVNMAEIKASIPPTRSKNPIVWNT